VSEADGDVEADEVHAGGAGGDTGELEHRVGESGEREQRGIAGALHQPVRPAGCGAHPSLEAPAGLSLTPSLDDRATGGAGPVGGEFGGGHGDRGDENNGDGVQLVRAPDDHGVPCGGEAGHREEERDMRKEVREEDAEVTDAAHRLVVEPVEYVGGDRCGERCDRQEGNRRAEHAAGHALAREPGGRPENDSLLRQRRLFGVLRWDLGGHGSIMREMTKAEIGMGNRKGVAC
jgi:hypothetical protein